MPAGGVAIVLLAAGQGSRYGASKLELELGGTALVRRAAQRALGAGARVIVVTGAHAERIAALLAGLHVTIAFNPDWALGMGHSIASGMAQLRQLQPAARAVLIALADQYRIGSAQFAALCERHAADPERIIAAACGTAVGAPCLFPRAYFDLLSGLRGCSGAQAVLRAHAAEVVAVPMPEAAFDIDTPQDYAEASRGAEG